MTRGNNLWRNHSMPRYKLDRARKPDECEKAKGAEEPKEKGLSASQRAERGGLQLLWQLHTSPYTFCSSGMRLSNPPSSSWGPGAFRIASECLEKSSSFVLPAPHREHHHLGAYDSSKTRIFRREKSFGREDWALSCAYSPTCSFAQLQADARGARTDKHSTCDRLSNILRRCATRLLSLTSRI